MRLATWNVNSLRTRIDRVEAFLDRHEVDVLALQETKAREDQLPLMGLQSRGYDVAAVGHDQWNGVAIVSRVGLEDVTVGFPGMPGYGEPLAAEARALGVRTRGRACFAVRELCQKMTWRPRTRVITNCDRFSRPRSSTRSMAAPRRTQVRVATRSMTSASSGHSSWRWQYTLLVRGHVSRLLRITPSPSGIRSR